jgi:aryl-alcohol dehydrogenase-like predicted oxidoreductase
METVDLGLTGLQVSRLCFGTGTNGWGGSSNQSRLGLKGLSRLLRFAYDQGVRFWDTADQYGTHPHVGAALKGLDRESVVITSKTTTRTEDGVTKDVERFLREMGTDYVDIVLLHCLTQADWPTRYPGAMEALSRAKEKGQVRAVGVSCHDFGAFQTAARTDWVEVVLARVNYAGKHMDAGPDQVVPVIEKMHAAGKGVYGMKVVGAGDLGKDARGAIRFLMGLSCVDAFVIGMMSEAQVLENIGLIGEFEGVMA